MGVSEEHRGRIRACLIGGAIGDALGAPVRGWRWPRIKAHFGLNGIREFVVRGGRKGTISDCTQLTLFTADGLIRALIRQGTKGICSPPSVVCHAYLRWLRLQQLEPAIQFNLCDQGWLWADPTLHARRGGDRETLLALRSLTHFTAERARNENRGCGAIARVAPAAFITASGGDLQLSRMVFEMAKSLAWITHGHPNGYLPAAAFATIVHGVLWRQSLDTAVGQALSLLKAESGSASTVKMLEDVMQGYRWPTYARPQFGSGRSAVQALGMAVDCVRREQDFSTSLHQAVNHGGDSSVTASMVGQLMGVRLGLTALPSYWIDELELADTIVSLADDLADFVHWPIDSYDDFTDKLCERYPPW